MLQQLREGLEVDAHYIISNLAPEMSERGSPKTKEGTEILDFFQDSLQELDEDTGEPLSVPSVMQWQTGQIVVILDHTCLQRMPNHTVCYPVVRACTNTITFPTAHLRDDDAFKSNIETAIKYGARFDRV
uniref:HECT domain-containing protein n=1 Tax=Salmo trutta TaxID=8032 RepID=A0A673XSW7_SALTR